SPSEATSSIGSRKLARYCRSCSFIPVSSIILLQNPPRLRGGGPAKLVEGGVDRTQHEPPIPLRQRFALPPPRERGGGDGPGRYKGGAQPRAVCDPLVFKRTLSA